MAEDWRRDLECWLELYLEALGNKTLRLMCPAYIAGLIVPGDRKSIQAMAVRQAILDRFSRPPPSRCPHCGERLNDEHLTLLPK